MLFSATTGASARTFADLVGTLSQFLAGIPTQPLSTWYRLGGTVLTVLVALILSRILRRYVERPPEVREVRQLRAKNREKHGIQVHLRKSQTLGRITSLSIWLAAVSTIGIIWLTDQGLTSKLSRQEVVSFLGDAAIRVGGSLLVLAAGLGIGRLLQRAVLGNLNRRVNRNLTLLFGRVIYVSTVVVAVVAILAIWGTGLVLPVALIGALTIGLSLSMQDVLRNLVSGIYLLVEHPFVIGDTITLAPYTGDVEDIQLRFTALRTADGQRVLIPNSMLFSLPVVNLTAYAQRRTGITVTVSDSGTNAVSTSEQQIRDALEQVAGILETPSPIVTLTRASGGKIELQVVFWLSTKDYRQNSQVISTVAEQVRMNIPGAEVTAMDAAATSTV